jgi:disulfide oxidoreductase YuzD
MTLRFILFYNRSHIVASNSNEKDFNVINFIRLTNFFFDVVFLRHKIKTEDDKKLLKDVFLSLTYLKQNFWYSFENSGNLNKFKYIFNVLLANPSQRVKYLDIEKNQKNVDDLVKAYLDK